MGKITVMLVDDEKWVLEDLESMFEWEKNGFEIVAAATNGKQALSKFRQASPQLVITDIKMPFMDGLELIREIKNLNTQAKIILLTAYSDFTYAKEAIKLGITDYVLKGEINEQSLSEKLLGVKELIDSESRTSFIISQKVILDLFNLAGSYSPEMSFSDQAVEKLLTTLYCYVVVEEDLPVPVTRRDPYENERHYEYEIISYSMSLSSDDFLIVSAGVIRKNKVLLVVKPGNSSSGNSLKSLLMQGAEAINELLKNTFHTSFTLYLIDNRLSLLEMKKLYFTYARRFYAKYFLGIGKTYVLSDNSLDWTESAASGDEALLADMVENMERSKVSEYIDALFSQILPPNMDYNGLVSVSQFLYAFLCKSVAALPVSADKPDLSAAANKHQWLSGESVKAWIKEKFEKLVDEKMKQRENKYSIAVIKAMEFIHRNYSNKELAINQIADYIGLSSTRLSVIFKKETGGTVNEFITDVRIKKAKELLCNGTYKVYEISSLVGYGSSQYFSQIFYNVTGFSPNDYRKGVAQ